MFNLCTTFLFNFVYQMSAFHRIRDSHNEILERNFRPVQPINRRLIQYPAPRENIGVEPLDNVLDILGDIHGNTETHKTPASEENFIAREIFENQEEE